MCALSNIKKMAYFYAACAVHVTILVLAGNSAWLLLLKLPILMCSFESINTELTAQGIHQY